MKTFWMTFVTAVLMTPLVGRSQMTSSEQTQITSWLGDGPLVFTDVFTSNTANPMTSGQFHAAVDGLGPTITIASVLTNGTGAYGGRSLVIGGFDPESWDSTGGNTGNGFNEAVPGEPTAFLFNLTTDTIQYENANSSGSDYETENSSDIGPAWGAGLDLAFGAYTGSGSQVLNRGGAFNYSYGGSFGTDILGVPPSFSNYNGGIYDTFTVSELDVYTFAPPPTASPTSGAPDGGATALLLAGAAAAMALLKSKRP